METQSLDNRDRDKLLEQIKSKCKSRAKSSAFGILIVLIVTIVFLFYLGQRLDDTKAISSFILWIVIGCFRLLGFCWDSLFASSFTLKVMVVGIAEIRRSKNNCKNSSISNKPIFPKASGVWFTCSRSIKLWMCTSALN